MAMHGLNQELAANVVNYREKKGPFHTVEDLIKVSEINLILHTVNTLDENLIIMDCG
jgi:DNA uptake protein ComE-like DNA-binding protein